MLQPVEWNEANLPTHGVDKDLSSGQPGSRRSLKPSADVPTRRAFEQHHSIGRSIIECFSGELLIECEKRSGRGRRTRASENPQRRNVFLHGIAPVSTRRKNIAIVVCVKHHGLAEFGQVLPTTRRRLPGCLPPWLLLPLLLLDVEENPENDRNMYYCARELMYYGRKEESIAMFKRHLALKSATWDAERAFSMRYIAKQSPEGSLEREQWLLRAVAEWGHGRECWVELAQHYMDTKNWVGMLDAANRALCITIRGDLYLTEAVMWGWLPHDLLALAAGNLDMMNIAVQHGQIAADMAPEDERLRNNLYFYKAKHAKVDVVIPTKSNLSGLTLLIAQLKRDYKVNRIVVVADGQKAYDMLNAIPNDIIKLMVPEGIGIHRMWNTAMKVLGSGNYMAFINDDISLAPNCMSTLMDVMLREPSIGLICPN